MQSYIRYVNFLISGELQILPGNWCEIWGDFNKFPDFFHMGTFIDSAHIKL